MNKGLHNSKTHVLVIDKPYSLDKVAEARAVNWALSSGACDKCEHLLKCSNDRNFKFPASAACMKKKAELLEVGE